jgi:hypothetical protein
VHRLEVLRIFAEKTGSPISERAGLSGKAGSDSSFLVACGLPRFARIDDRRPHLPAQEYRLRHKRFPFRHGGPLSNYILNPSPVNLAALALRALSAGRFGLAFASKRKICNSLFFSSEANLKILLTPYPPRLTVPRFRNG